MPSMGVGYPDGDNRPTVTMDYRRTYTMSPTSTGKLSFGIATGFHGCFVKGLGSMTTNVDFRSAYITANGVFAMESGVSSLAENRTGLVPIATVEDRGYATFRAYRPIVAVAEVSFTGSSMENGGSVVIAKTSAANPPQGVFGSSDPVDNVKTNYAPTYVSPVMSGTSVVGPARDSYVSRVVPADPEFIPYQAASVGIHPVGTDLVINGIATPASAGRKVASMPCAQAGAVWYNYSGLHSSATVTVTVRYCCQYSVDGDSALVPLAKPSPPPPENPGVLSRMFSAITNSPAALNFAAGTVGHLLPASRPILAIAAEAYNNS